MSAIGLLRSGVHNSAQKKLVHHLALKCDELAVRELRAFDHASKALGAPTNAAASRGAPQEAFAADPSAGPPQPATRPKPPLSIGSTLPSPLLFPRQFPLLA
jgi:hypothetical protein